MHKHTRQQGFTLMELIIGLVVLAVLGAAAGYGLANGALAFVNTTDAVHTLGKLRYASERMAREIREIRRDPVAPSLYDISTMAPTVLAFTKTDGTDVTLSGAPPLATLSYSSPAGTYVLTDEVGTLSFAYYQADGSTPATGDWDLAFVEFELILTRSGNSYPQRSRVALRNRQ